MAIAEHTIQFLCPTSEVAPDCPKRVELADRPPLAIFNLNGEFYVTDDTCTHGEASLCDGEIDGDVVECPFHQGAFDIRTGEAVGAPCVVNLKTYPVVIENGVIGIRLDQ
ncbi:non-heme iron oxygenase ferredoxin subunit [Ottowia thiooxydans]|uniref:Nitrite reductase/ring-hydroxylating ferredoxin subunit n=1 Tax=Ottowia thiooxydans TaxID=219182 RepID=A0ABV2QDD1_9BURK